jgi:CubicO group peptidase (beta-lactamase class C family)
MCLSRTTCALVCIYFFSDGISSASAAPVDAKAIDAIVREALKAWHVPGVAVAIVKDGEVIYLQGHGVKKLGKNDPVTPDTIFPIASCTKAFTTAAMALLVDDGKMNWDDPVRKHVPSFHLSDPVADADVRLRDLLCHRTGVGSHDYLWYRAPWDQDEMIQRIGLVKPDKPFRTALQYQSVMFMVAGRAIETASGATWSEFVKKRILAPLEMKNTCFTTTEVQKAKDIASPHRRMGNGEVGVVSRYPEETPGSASSIQSSARDMAQWVKFQLSDGIWNGKRLISQKNLQEMHTPQIAVRMEGSIKDTNPHTNLMSYGLAWLVQDYHGHKVISHAGAIDGFRAQIFLVPESHLGIVLLNNLQDTRMNLALGNCLIDHLLDLPKRDWNDRLHGITKQEEAKAKELREERAKQAQPDAKPSKELASFAGEYKDPAYGSSRVYLEDGKLVWRWSAFSCPLDHFAKNTFVSKHEYLGIFYLTFQLSDKSEVVNLQIGEPLKVVFNKTK